MFSILFLYRDVEARCFQILPFAMKFEPGIVLSLLSIFEPRCSYKIVPLKNGVFLFAVVDRFLLSG